WNGRASDRQIADAFQFRSEPLHIECVFLEFATTLYPEQEKMCRPSIGVGLRSTVSQIHSAIQDCVARLHLDCERGFVAEILDARVLARHSSGADFKRPWQIVAIG